MKRRPLISVLMAVYNAGSQKELDMAVSSILLQSASDLELIICSDGADEETLSTIKRWKKRDTRVIVVENPRNLGAGIARNKAAHLASGRYIAIMDADDASAFDRLERQITFLEANPQFAFVGTRGTYFTNEPGDRADGYWYVARPEPGDFLMTLPFVHASLLFRRDAFFSAGGYRELKRVTRSEDYDLLLRLYTMGLRGANLPETLYFIRMNEATLKRRKYKYRIFEFAVKLEGFINLGLMPEGIAFSLKPLIVGLIPQKILRRLKTNYYNDKT